VRDRAQTAKAAGFAGKGPGISAGSEARLRPVGRQPTQVALPVWLAADQGRQTAKEARERAQACRERAHSTVVDSMVLRDETNRLSHLCGSNVKAEQSPGYGLYLSFPVAPFGPQIAGRAVFDFCRSMQFGDLCHLAELLVTDAAIAFAARSALPSLRLAAEVRGKSLVVGIRESRAGQVPRDALLGTEDLKPTARQPHGHAAQAHRSQEHTPGGHAPEANPRGAQPPGADMPEGPETFLVRHLATTWGVKDDRRGRTFWFTLSTAGLPSSPRHNLRSAHEATLARAPAENGNEAPVAPVGKPSHSPLPASRPASGLTTKRGASEADADQRLAGALTAAVMSLHSLWAGSPGDEPQLGRASGDAWPPVPGSGDGQPHTLIPSPAEVLWAKVVERANAQDWRGWCHALCCTAVEVVRSACSAALGLRSPEGTWELAAATDQWAEALEEAEYALGEGPATTAFSLNRPVVSGDIAGDGRRWPGFSQLAFQAGLSAALAIPLSGKGGAVVGTLTLYSRKPNTIGATEVLDAVTLGQLAATVLLVDLDGLSAGPGQGPSSLDRRIRIASGMVAGQLGVNIEHALAIMRARAFAMDCSLSAVAEGILARKMRLA
jgi:hypothetical protein